MDELAAVEVDAAAAERDASVLETVVDEAALEEAAIDEATASASRECADDAATDEVTADDVAADEVTADEDALLGTTSTSSAAAVGEGSELVALIEREIADDAADEANEEEDEMSAAVNDTAEEVAVWETVAVEAVDVDTVDETLLEVTSSMFSTCVPVGVKTSVTDCAVMFCEESSRDVRSPSLVTDAMSEPSGASDPSTALAAAVLSFVVSLSLYHIGWMTPVSLSNAKYWLLCA